VIFPSSAETQVKRLLLREKALATFGILRFLKRIIARYCLSLCRRAPNALMCRSARLADINRRKTICLSLSAMGGNQVSLAALFPSWMKLYRRSAPSTGEPKVCTHGVLEVDNQTHDAFDAHGVDFLTSFADAQAEAVATSERSETLKNTIASMETLVVDRELHTQELKHRIRNNLHLVYGLLTPELVAEHDQDSIDVFGSIALRVMGLAEVFDHLPGVGMNEIISFGDYVTALCANLPELHKDQDLFR
jgi:two-component sensor histidine kinase